MITLLKKIAISNVSNLAQTVTLDNVMEGVDGAAAFGYSLETESIQVEDNQTQQYKHNHVFDIRVIDSDSDNSILDGFIADQTDVNITGLGLNGVLLIRNVKLARNKQYDGIIATAVLATKTTSIGYYDNGVFTEQELFAGRNMLETYQLDFTKSNVAGAESSVWQNGFKYDWVISSVDTNENVVTSNVISTGVELTRPKTDTGYVQWERIYYPFGDTDLVATINVVAINDAGSPSVNARLGVTMRDDSLVGIDTAAINLQTGKNAFQFTTNTATAQVAMFLRPADTATSNIVYDEIGLYLDGSEPASYAAVKALPTYSTTNIDPTI